MNKFIKSIILSVILIPGLALAQGQGGFIQNPLKVNSIAELIAVVLNLIVSLGTPILVLAFVYVGFLFVAARGNEQGLTKAKSAFFYTVIGAALVLGAFVISEVIQNTVSQLQ